MVALLRPEKAFTEDDSLVATPDEAAAKATGATTEEATADAMATGATGARMEAQDMGLGAAPLRYQNVGTGRSYISSPGDCHPML